MKVITEQYLHSIEVDIIKERERLALHEHKEFSGLSQDELSKEVYNRIGEPFIVKRDPPVLDKSDIGAVANSRFYRRIGQRYLMIMMIAVVAIAAVMRYIPNLSDLQYRIGYIACGAIALVFLYVYSRKQAKERKDLWARFGRDEKGNSIQ